MKDVKVITFKKASELPPGAISLGSQLVNKTGSWRAQKPVLDREKCVKCMLCWKYCPDVAISPEIEIDYEYCKGCGICAYECPTYAIVMVEEVVE
ncbi:MAG: 4Fe-4S binding protein [Candidatus Methanofastidiosia archaeon]